jgi:hypothetical protein
VGDLEDENRCCGEVGCSECLEETEDDERAKVDEMASGDCEVRMIKG